jgi:hypothetical protein
LGEADSEGLGDRDAGDRKKRRKLRRRNKHVLIKVPFGINRCRPTLREQTLLQGEGRV